ncbi:MAG: VOC family protein [Roseitalea porphyridii]|jgi:PhnB protein|uniref:VOC family protein n=1 Tax=Roseitalea porphyridii TaxID=1852022 RepID=UPI0032EE7C2B
MLTGVKWDAKLMSTTPDSYKPIGYPDVAPYLVVSDAQATLDFVKAVFGSDPMRVHTDDNDNIVHAEARIGDSVVMIGQMPGGPDALVHIYVPDPDETFGRAIDAGALEIDPLRDRADGDRRGGVKDKNGTQWFFARAII